MAYIQHDKMYQYILEQTFPIPRNETNGVDSCHSLTLESYDLESSWSRKYITGTDTLASESGNMVYTVAKQITNSIVSDEEEKSSRKGRLISYEQLGESIMSMGPSLAATILDPRGLIVCRKPNSLKMAEALYLILNKDKITLEVHQMELIFTSLITSLVRICGSELKQEMPTVLEKLQIIPKHANLLGRANYKLISDAYERHNKKLTILAAPRRNGKSTSVAICIAILLWCKDGANIYVYGHENKSARIYLPLVRHYCEILQESGLQPRAIIHSTIQSLSVYFPHENKRTLTCIAATATVSIYISSHVLQINILEIVRPLIYSPPLLPPIHVISCLYVSY